MAKAPKKPAAKANLPFNPQPVVIQNCVAAPNPVVLSRTGLTGPNQVYFTTPDRDRVYEVKIKGKVFKGKPGAFKMDVWFGKDSETLTVDPKAKKETFTYDIRVDKGTACSKGTTVVDPPTIMVED